MSTQLPERRGAVVCTARAPTGSSVALPEQPASCTEGSPKDGAESLSSDLSSDVSSPQESVEVIGVWREPYKVGECVVDSVNVRNVRL